MIKEIKFSKLALVLFLTLLIWVWANRALDETYPIYNATIVVSSTNPKLWVYFPQGSSIDVNEIKVSGPSSRINNIENIITSDPGKLAFTLIPEQFGVDKSGPKSLNVLDIIKKSNWIKKEGLSVVSCDPCEVTINAITLIQKDDIDVQCFGEDELPRELETPQKVTMYVPPDWRGNARVDLKPEEVQRAVKRPIAKKPYIILPNGQRKDADKTVEIKLSPQENILVQQTVQNVTVGYALSQNILTGKYQIEILNMPDLINFEILTTQAAKDAYEDQLFQVLVEVKESDIQTTEDEGFVRRDVHYPFPEEFVRRDEIKLAQEKAAEARFKVLPPPQPPAEVLP